MSPMLIALGAMFVQQTFASVGKTLPAVVAPLVIAELHADPAWVGVYYGLSAAASLFANGLRQLHHPLRRASHEPGRAGAAGRRHGGGGPGRTAWLRRLGGYRRRRRGGVDPDQLAIAWPGLASPPGAAGVLDQADRRTRRRADLRF